MALGSKAAWSRLEKLFAKDGLSDGELAVKRALDRVGAADPDELRDLASKVRSGNYADVSRELVEVVGRALDEEADSDETGGVSEDALIDDEAEPPDAVEAIDEAAADEEAAREEAVFHEAAPREEGSAEEAPDEAPMLVGEPSDDIPRVVGAPVGAAVIASSPPLPGGSTEPERQAPEMVAGPEQPAPEAVAKPARPSPEAVPTPVPPSLEVVTEPDTGPTLSAAEKLGLLRTLRADPGYGARLGRAGRAQLLVRLGPGWAARRALSELIRGQAVDDLDEALQLAGDLLSDVQNAWCLGDLVQHWALDETELERVLQAARNPAAASRLRGRHGRRGSSRGA